MSETKEGDKDTKVAIAELKGKVYDVREAGKQADKYARTGNATIGASVPGKPTEGTCISQEWG